MISHINRSGLERRAHGGRGTHARTTRTWDEKFPDPENFSADLPTEKQIKAEFSAVILPFPVDALATAADCSPDTVKCWRSERSFPQGRHLMRLVEHFPAVRAWHSRRTGGLDHPHSQAEMFGYLEKIMASDTAEGRAMRARLREIVRGD